MEYVSSILEVLEGLLRTVVSIYSVGLNSYLIIAIGLLYVLLRFTHRRGLLGTVGGIVGYIPTIIHELGHVLVCKLFLGKVEDIVIIHLRRNQEKRGAYGYAITYNKGKIASALKAFSGYLTPPFVLLGVLYLNSIERLYIALILALVVTLYIIYKTSNKIPVIISVLITTIVLVILTTNGLIVEDMVNVFLGLLLGEVLLTLIKLPKFKNTGGWDGSFIREEVMIPQTVSILMWYIFIIPLLIASIFYII